MRVDYSTSRQALPCARSTAETRRMYSDFHMYVHSMLQSSISQAMHALGSTQHVCAARTAQFMHAAAAAQLEPFASTGCIRQKCVNGFNR
jgi:hypothetical protein